MALTSPALAALGRNGSKLQPDRTVSSALGACELSGLRRCPSPDDGILGSEGSEAVEQIHSQGCIDVSVEKF